MHVEKRKKKARLIPIPHLLPPPKLPTRAPPLSPPTAGPASPNRRRATLFARRRHSPVRPANRHAPLLLRPLARPLLLQPPARPAALCRSRTHPPPCPARSAGTVRVRLRDLPCALPAASAERPAPAGVQPGTRPWVSGQRRGPCPLMSPASILKHACTRARARRRACAGSVQIHRHDLDRSCGPHAYVVPVRAWEIQLRTPRVVEREQRGGFSSGDAGAVHAREEFDEMGASERARAGRVCWPLSSPLRTH
jgi:hypothetical protein